MFTVGVVLLFVGGMGWLGFVVNKLRSGRLAATPFVKTGDAAQQGAQIASPKGAISVEGRVQCQQPVTSPVTQTQCLYYELEVKATWKAGEQKGAAVISSEKVAASFGVDDGSGLVKVDVSKGGSDLGLAKVFNQSKGTGLKQDVMGAPLAFGERGFSIKPVHVINGMKIPGDAKFEVTEKCLMPLEKAYVNGRIQPDGSIGSPSWTSLIVSKHSRDELAGKAVTFAKRSMILASVGTVAGAALAVAGQLTGS